MPLTLTNLFDAAGLSPCGPIPWGQPCVDRRPGIYVITIDQGVVYIGQTTRSLARHLHEFYRHKYGDTRPHCGGQEILNMPGDRLVYWCSADDPREAERRMIAAYEECYRCLPAGNRRRGDKINSLGS